MKGERKEGTIHGRDTSKSTMNLWGENCLRCSGISTHTTSTEAGVHGNLGTAKEDHYEGSETFNHWAEERILAAFLTTTWQGAEKGLRLHQYL